MKIETEYPYNEYNGYIIINRENRRHVCLVHKENKSRTTISYARYLMSVKEKRFLTKEEQVDHIDEDKTNDDINNLQILSFGDNIRKTYKDNNRTRKMVEMKCPQCNSIFCKTLSSSFIQKKGHYNVCSKECLYVFLKNKMTIQEMKDVGIAQIIRYYRR
jgi:hypothetical protein